jgi:hypothetical protein
MRCAQLEMVGLVFVVVLVVMGLLLYLSLSSRQPVTPSRVPERASSFMVALIETDVPECGVVYSSLARECLLGSDFCSDPCGKLQNVTNTVLAYSLAKEGMRYNITLEGTSVYNASGCEGRLPAFVSPNPINLASGAKRNLVLTICK